jgi:hypothetical protein
MFDCNGCISIRFNGKTKVLLLYLLYIKHTIAVAAIEIALIIKIIMIIPLYDSLIALTAVNSSTLQQWVVQQSIAQLIE